MANKRNNNVKQQAERRARFYREECNKTSHLHIASIIIVAFAFLMLLVDFTSIYNGGADSSTGKVIGTEVGVSGWSFFFAGLTGDFESAESVYGNIGVFYYWAPQITENICMVVIFAVFSLAVTLALEIITLSTKQHFLTVAAMAFGLLSAVLFVVIYVLQASYLAPVVRDTPSYCNGNTACCIKSAALVPFVVMLVYEAFDVFICKKLLQAKKAYGD